MRIPRVLIRGPLEPDQTVDLPKEQAHHLIRVLRLRDGHELTVFDGMGREFSARLVGERQARIDRPLDHIVESPLSVRLLQGISRGQKMDYALQKAVELGVTVVQPVFCERSVVRLDGPRLAKRMGHWLGVIESACAQCGRSRVPDLVDPIPLLDATPPERGVGVFLDPDTEQAFSHISVQEQLTLVIGPEGGLSPSECRHLREQYYQGARLGPRVLRTETASVAALTAAQLLWGDLRH